MIEASVAAGLPFWQDLTDSEKKTVCESCVLRRWRKEEQIFGTSGRCLGMIMVLRGTVRTFLLSEEGREVTLFRLKKGDSCVLSASCVIRQITFETQMVAEEDCELLILHTTAFARLTEQNIRVRCYLYEMAAERFSSVMWTLQEILFKRFDRRLAGFLLRRWEEEGTTELRLTHEQIARDVGSAREVVTRMLKRFAADGLVTLKRGCILLTDREGLQDLAEY